MSDEIAIQVNSVSKNFILPHRSANSVKSIITGFYRRNTGSGGKEVQHALRDINITINKGEFFGIVGRNGSGKSTLLKILAGIYQPTTGSIETRGKLVPFIELGVGFNPELTGRENVYLNGSMLGFSQKEVDDMYDDIVSFAELERFMDQKLKNYSSGMQVRLAFSMATRSEADILLVDEVLAVGDADFQRKCFDYFRELKKNRKTVVFVSHDMNAVREYCDRAVLIEKSRLVKSGTSDEVATAYSRMFIEASRSNSRQKKTAGNRWGSQELRFKDVSVEQDKLTDNNPELVLKTTVSAAEDMDDIVMGFFIKNATGTPILGTNNQLLKQNLKSIRKGDEVELVWTIPNIFSEGIHEVTVALESNAKVCDWWEGAVSFGVFLERNTPYATSPQISLESTYRERSV